MAEHDDLSDQKEKVKGFFNDDVGWKGGFYEDTTRPFSRMLGRRKAYAMEMLGVAADRRGGLAVDLGCGSGVYLSELATMGYQTFGMDLSPEMVRVARTKSAPHVVRLVSGDVERVPFRTASFDVVLSIGVLGYLHEDDRALREIDRILKPGGLLMLNVRNRFPLTSLHYSVRRELRSNRGSSSDVAIADWTGDLRGYHNKVYTLKKFEKVIAQYGYALIDSRTFGHEFTITRKFNLLPKRFVDWMELTLERVFRAVTLPYFSYSGWGYIGLFRKDPHVKSDNH